MKCTASKPRTAKKLSADANVGHGFAKRMVYGLLGVLVACGIWQLVSTRIGVPLVLPGPSEVAHAFVVLMWKSTFWEAVWGTFQRVLIAFVISLALGFCTGMIAGLNAPFRDMIAPFVTIIRATPVMALILILMFWFPAGHVPVVSAMLMAYPVVHTSLYQGTIGTDKNLLEMARIFKVPKPVVFFRLRLPAVRGHLASAAKNCLGLCWKVIVAGEVLSQPRFALGTGLQSARLSLDTAGVFAWAITSIALCGISEFLLGLVARKLQEEEAINV